MWRSSRDEAFVLRSLLTSEAALENVQPAVVSHKHTHIEPLINSFLLWWQRHFSVKALITLAAFYYFSHSFTTSYKTKNMQSHHSKKQSKIRRRKHRILCFCSFLHDFFFKRCDYLPKYSLCLDFFEWLLSNLKHLKWGIIANVIVKDANGAAHVAASFLLSSFVVCCFWMNCSR